MGVRLVAPWGAGGPQGANLGCSLVHPQSTGDEHEATLLPTVLPEAWHTHHTPAQNTLHFSEGGHGGVPALVVEVPAASEAACPRPVCLHGVSQLGDTLLRGCRKGHWEAASPQWGHPMASLVVAWGSMWVLPGEQKAGRGAGTWALLAAVGGAGTHGVGTGEPWALNLLAVHFTRGALRGVQGTHGRHGAIGTRHTAFSLV